MSWAQVQLFAALAAAALIVVALLVSALDQALRSLVRYYCYRELARLQERRRYCRDSLAQGSLTAELYELRSEEIEIELRELNLFYQGFVNPEKVCQQK